MHRLFGLALIVVAMFAVSGEVVSECTKFLKPMLISTPFQHENRIMSPASVSEVSYPLIENAFVAVQDPWKARISDRLELLESKIDRLVLSVEHLTDRMGSGSSAVLQHSGGGGNQPNIGVSSAASATEAKLAEFDLSALVIILFIHEVWVFMQHANVLMNPYLQRLDRNYGIALLKKRLYWVIAGVLGAYWAREVGSLLLCYSYVSSSTQTMILLSSAYHVGKILLISLDAVRRFSPRLGIMSLVIDNWHLDSLMDILVTVKRVVLQGFDTAVHLSIVYDMCAARPELWTVFFYIASVWTLHTIACQVTKKSTATLFVEAFKHAIYGNVGSSGSSKKNDDLAVSESFFLPSTARSGTASRLISEEQEQLQVMFVLGGSAALLLVSLVGAALGRLSWFTLYVVVSLVAAAATSVMESIRCCKAGPETKEVVRYLLSRDKPRDEAQHGARSDARGPEALRTMGHYAGWCAPQEQVKFV